MTKTQNISKTRKHGDVLIGIGTVIAVLAAALLFLTGSSGGTSAIWMFFFGGLFMVVIGYLQRVTSALERS